MKPSHLEALDFAMRMAAGSSDTDDDIVRRAKKFVDFLEGRESQVKTPKKRK